VEVLEVVPDFAAAAEGSITKGDIVVAIDGVQVLFFLLVALYSSTCNNKHSTKLAWGDRSFLQQCILVCAFELLFLH
jgi:predicted metalloprotease with PDZ domain